MDILEDFVISDCHWTSPGTRICMEPVYQGMMINLSPRDFKRLMVKNIAAKHLDVSTPEGIFNIMYYVIKV